MGGDILKVTQGRSCCQDPRTSPKSHPSDPNLEQCVPKERSCPLVVFSVKLKDPGGLLSGPQILIAQPSTLPHPPVGK